MSPRSSPRKRHQRQHRVHDQRRSPAPTARETVPPELLSMMLAAGKDMVRGDGPLEAEGIASNLVGIWWGRELVDADIEEALGGALVAEAARRRTAESLTLLTALASVAGDRLAARAAEAAQALDRVGVTGPAWLDQVGQARHVASYRSWDEAGDAFSVLSLFSYDGAAPHSVCVLVDRNLGGLAKDAWLADAGLEVVELTRQECAASELMTLEELDPGLARELVEDAFAVTERALRHDPPVSDEVRSFRAQVLARMRLLPDGVPLSLTQLPEDIRFLGDGLRAERDRFLATGEVGALGRPRIVKACVDAILDYGSLCDDGRILRVSPVKNELLLVEWLPVWAGLSGSQVAVMPEVLALWSRYAGARAGLPAEVVSDALASINLFGPGLAAAVAAADKSGVAFLRAHVDGYDTWERADSSDRLLFALLAEPGALFDPGPGGDEDGMREISLVAHPEYDDAPLPDVRTAPDEEVAPHLHLALHDVVAGQLWEDDPPEVWRTARRVMLGGYDQHEIHHMLAFALAEPLHAVMVGGEPFDLDSYRARLGDLPGSWETLRSS